MELKHPEICYFLLLLVIPILVHLFQLRRFQKEYFTNVHFLKKINIQTQKSSRLKKWLLLITRLLLLTCIILAFAQPYFTAKNNTTNNNEMFIILDNSFSMQAKGKKGPLLKRVVQDLLEKIPENRTFSLLTNTDTYWNTDIKSIQKELQQLKYSHSPFQLEHLITKVKTKKTTANKNLIIITDAIELHENQLKSIDTTFLNTYFIIQKAENKNNVSVDSVYIDQVLENFYKIKVKLSSYGKNNTAVPVALYNDKNLVAKTLVNFETKYQEITFTIPKENFHGYILITDNALEYDNNFFFSISKPERLNILNIGKPEKSTFLSKIYTSDEFNFTSSDLNILDYNLIEQQDAIVINELKEIPSALQTTLKAFTDKGGNLILIPSSESTLTNLNSLSLQLSGLQFKELEKKEKKITKIAFDNPLYKSVFEKKTDNFQYPATKSSFVLKSTFPPALLYEDQSAFLTAVTGPLSSVYLFSAPINKENSNFQNSPLIVPTFYNMVQNNRKKVLTTMTIGDNKPLLVNEIVSKNEILTVKNDTESFIPMQQIINNKVKLTFNDYPKKAGNFSIYRQEKLLEYCSFNYRRTESDLKVYDKQLLSKYKNTDHIDSIFAALQTNSTKDEIWRWFIILALLFLITEIFIQKFVK